MLEPRLIHDGGWAEKSRRESDRKVWRWRGLSGNPDLRRCRDCTIHRLKPSKFRMRIAVRLRSV